MSALQKSVFFYHDDSFMRREKKKNTNGWNEPESADESDAFLVGYIRSLFLFENIAAQ